MEDYNSPQWQREQVELAISYGLSTGRFRTVAHVKLSKMRRSTWSNLLERFQPMAGQGTSDLVSAIDEYLVGRPRNIIS